MPRTQIGLRLPTDEADALRRAAHARRMSLGKLVTTLLRESRADSGRGLWLELDPINTTALRAVAAAAESTPERVLQRMVRRWLAADLARLRQDLLDGAPADLAPAAVAPTETAPTPEDPLDEPDEVLFTVSED